MNHNNIKTVKVESLICNDQSLHYVVVSNGKGTSEITLRTNNLEYALQYANNYGLPVNHTSQNEFSLRFRTYYRSFLALVNKKDPECVFI